MYELGIVYKIFKMNKIVGKLEEKVRYMEGDFDEGI